MPDLDPYQVVGAQHLARTKKAALNDEPGLGKTPQAIEAVDLLELPGSPHVLVICPAILRPNWGFEWQRWSFLGTRPAVLLSLDAEPPRTGVVVVSFEYAMARYEALIAAGRWDAIIVDESQKLKTVVVDDRGYLSNAPQRCHAILGADGLVHHTDRFWTLSGTPAERHAGELWMLLYVLGVTKMTYEEWIATYCIGHRNSFGFRVRGSNKAKLGELHDLLYKTSGFALRRRVEDVALELPELRYEYLTIDPTPFDPSITPSFMDRAPEKLERMLVQERAELEAKLRERPLNVEEWQVLASLAKHLVTLRLYIEMQKAGTIGELVASELADGTVRKIVIFGQFRDPIKFLAKRLEKFNPVVIWGGLKEAKRDLRINNFQTSAPHRVALCQIDAASLGITLTAAHEGILMSQSWVPAINDQAARRLARRTQTHRVRMRVAQLTDSLDQRIAAILARRGEELAIINGDAVPAAISEPEL